MAKGFKLSVSLVLRNALFPGQGTIIISWVGRRYTFPCKVGEKGLNTIRAVISMSLFFKWLKTSI